MKNTKYTPPPGYDGNAFTGSGEYGMREIEEMLGGGVSAKYVEPKIRSEPDRRVSDEAAEEYSDDGDTPILENADEFEFSSAEEVGQNNSHSPVIESPDTSHQTAISKEESPVENIMKFIQSLRGRFGSEELILILVMFLISSDGIGAEALILALLLIAG